MLICNNVFDLDGLSNCCGLVLEVGRFTDTKKVYVDVVNMKQDKLLYRTKIENTADIEVLKSFGFKFEYRYKKNLEDVLNKYKEKEFEFGKDNYYLFVSENGKFNYSFQVLRKSIGTKYYSQEDCIKICNELNG